MTIQNLSVAKQRQAMAVSPEALRPLDRSTTNNNNNHNNKSSRISFSVASLLADTRPRSKASPLRDEDLEANSRISPEIFHHHQINPHSPLRQSPQARPELPGQKRESTHSPQIRMMSPMVTQNSSPPLNLNNSNAATPPLMTSSEDEYEDSVNQEDSIVDVEDLNIDGSVNGEDGRTSDEEREMIYRRQRQLLQEREGPGQGPIRPTPFSALAAAAAAYQAGLGAPPPGWPVGPPVLGPFGPGGPMFQGPGFPVSHLSTGK